MQVRGALGVAFRASIGRLVWRCFGCLRLACFVLFWQCVSLGPGEGIVAMWEKFSKTRIMTLHAAAPGAVVSLSFDELRNSQVVIDDEILPC